jgi:hypothetical protein
MFRFRNRRTGAMRTLYGSTAVLAVAVLAMVGWTTISAGAAAGAATSASKPPLCASSAVEVTATTNRSAYSPGQIVKLKSSATNVSATACSLWLGLDPGFSPSFTVTNAANKEVWDRCWDNDQPGACFEILYQKRLDPGRTYHTVAQWDQGSSTTPSQPPQRVPPGTYTFSTYYQYIGGAHVKFTISPATTIGTAAGTAQ